MLAPGVSMKRKRKSPKPITLLTRVEGLLSDAVDGLSAIEASVEKSVRELLVVAEASVARAKDLIAKDVVALAPAGAARRSTVRAKKRGRRRVVASRAR
jgi:hypothetical protein